MAKRRRTSSKKAARTAQVGWMEEAFRALWPPIRRGLPWVLLGLVLAGGAGFGASRVRRSVADRDRFRIRTADLYEEHFEQLGPFRLRIPVEPVGLPEHLSALEEGVATRIARAYAAAPWVEDVRLVKVTHPNVVTRSLAVRRPVAFIQLGEVYYWVDRMGVNLPLPEQFRRRMPAETGLMFIRGVRGPVPPEGSAWTDRGVRAGAEVAVVLADDARTLGLTAIDVSNIDGRVDRGLSEIVILNTKFTRILWGRAPGSDRPGELSTADKLHQLRAAHSGGYLEAGQTVDIRFPHRAIRRPSRP